MTGNSVAGQKKTTPSEENLRTDYEQTIQQVNVLADVRFKLLAFVPTLTATAIALLTSDKVTQGTVLSVGLLGFFSVFGIAIYDQRNSQIYDAALNRAARLERMLHMPGFSRGMSVGGLYSERPAGRQRKLFGIKVWHDRALAFVYGTALGGWFYIIVYSFLSMVSAFFHWPEFLLLNQHVDVVYIASLLIAIAVTCAFIWKFHKLDGTYIN